MGVPEVDTHVLQRRIGNGISLGRFYRLPPYL